MTTFGERLRNRRESREVSLEEIAESTKIQKRYLEALENDDFDALPGGMFAKGYLRSYAEAIGVDPEPLLEDYLKERRDHGEGDPTEDERAAHEAAQAALSRLAGVIEDPAAESRRRRNRVVLGASIVLIVLVAAVWAAMRLRGPDQEATPAAEPVVAEQSAAVEDSPPIEPATTPVEPATPPVETGAPEETRPGDQPGAREETAGPDLPPSISRTPPPVESTPEPEAEPSTRPEPQAESSAPSEEPAVEPVPSPGMTIPDFGVGTGVVNRQLVGRSDRFAEGTSVTFWTRVLDGQRGDVIEHVWLRDGRRVWTFQLNIGGPHWRTQSRYTLRQGSTGDWTVEARDRDGRLLARASFVCEAVD